MSAKLQHLYQALESDLGIVIEVTDIERARQTYYRLRREANDPQLEALSFVPSPENPSQLWIVKRRAEPT